MSFGSGGFRLSAQSSFSGGVIYTLGGDGTSGYIRAYQEGTWKLLGQWTNIPGLTSLKSGQPASMAQVRGVAYDNGFMYIAVGGYGGGGTPNAGQIIKWNLTTHVEPLGFPVQYKNYGMDQLAACRGALYVPVFLVPYQNKWDILSEANGAVLGQLSGPSNGPHNTICTVSGGLAHVYLGPNCNPCNPATSYLGQATCSTATSCTMGTPVGHSVSAAGGVRPFTVGRSLTRTWLTWTDYRGFSIGSLGTGHILKSVSFGTYSTSGCPSAPSHGISVSPDNKEVYVLDSPMHTAYVYSGTDSPQRLAKITLDPYFCADPAAANIYFESSAICMYDCFKEGWVDHTFDGKYVVIGDAGDIIDTATHSLVVSSTTGNSQLHSDLANTRHGFLNVDWAGGVPVSGSHFGVGQ